MKNIFIGIIILFTACNTGEDYKYKSVADSLDIARQADSMTQAVIYKAATDTTGSYLSPVKILSAKPIQEEYSNYKNIQLSFKNVSNKAIAGIRFNWYGENTFNEPADMGVSIAEGVGGGFTDHTLKPGKSTTAQWNILSRDLKKVKMAWVTEVAFEDGTKWELRK